MNNKTRKSEHESLSDYLQLIQEPITRMSNMSAILKGFSASLFAGFYVFEASVFSNNNPNTPFLNCKNLLLLFLMVAPILIFMRMDIYYLQLERKHRYLYKKVAKGYICEYYYQIEIDKNITIEETKEAKARICDCLKSPSIKCFYIPIILLQIALFIAKATGVI